MRSFIGDGVRNLVTRVLGPPGPSDPALLDRAVAEFRRHYGAHLFDRTAPYPGIVALLDGLATRNIPVAVLSNKMDQATRAIVDRFFPGRFAAVVGERDGVPRKPDPTAALALAARLGVPPARCFLVGDGAADMEAAVRAGMMPIGVTWGFRGAEELREHGASAIIDRPDDVLGILDASAVALQACCTSAIADATSSD